MAVLQTQSREIAMQILFAWDALGQADPETARQISEDMTDKDGVRQQAIELAKATWDQRDVIDQRIERHTPNWPPRRQPAVDRNLLRIGVYQLTNTDIAPLIVIDDIVNLTHLYSTASSYAFIHAVLDAVFKEHQAVVAGLPTRDPAVVPPPSEPLHAEPEPIEDSDAAGGQETPDTPDSDTPVAGA